MLYVLQLLIRQIAIYPLDNVITFIQLGLVILAAKRKQEGYHWSEITRAFLRREDYRSSITCRSEAKKQRHRNLLSHQFFLISHLSRV